MTPQPGHDVPTLTVVVPTYRRPGVLSQCLSAVLEHTHAVERDGAAAAVSVLVIDNDPAGGARAEVAGYREAGVRYVHEPVAGIAAARARALREVDTRLLVFIDDDEVPRDGWLAALLDTWRDTGAAAVMGRVESVLRGGPVHPWITAGDLFARPRFLTGTRLPAAAAGNMLLDVEWVHAHGLTFDTRLGLGGGEDTLFTKQVIRAGGAVVSCDESVADDLVPVERINRRWLVRRFYSQGHATVVVEVLLSPRRAPLFRVRAGAGGLGRALIGAVRFALACVRRSQRDQALAMCLVSRGAGMLTAAFGRAHHEYHRAMGGTDGG